MIDDSWRAWKLRRDVRLGRAPAALWHARQGRGSPVTRRVVRTGAASRPLLGMRSR